ncbi:MAG: hypothetical protein JNL74_16785 [Fibrobacteres bacterium]|nr:hypothetical protein [Fibrobacterota bacterium]
MKIKIPDLHIHSIMSHIPSGAVPLSLIFFYDHFIHSFLLFVALLTMAPVILTGWITRNQQYTNWSKPFIIKTVLSFLLFIVVTSMCSSIIITSGNVPQHILYKLAALFLAPTLSIAVTLMGIVITHGKFAGKESFSNDKEASLKFDITNSIKEAARSQQQDELYDRI